MGSVIKVLYKPDNYARYHLWCISQESRFSFITFNSLEQHKMKITTYLQKKLYFNDSFWKVWSNRGDDYCYLISAVFCNTTKWKKKLNNLANNIDLNGLANFVSELYILLIFCLYFDISIFVGLIFVLYSNLSTLYIFPVQYFLWAM